MDNPNVTSPNYKLEFVVFALEATAQKANIPTEELFDRLNRLGLVQSVLLDCYETLHTQSRNYITDVILEALQAWEEDHKKQQKGR